MEDKIKLLNTKLDYFEGNLLSAKAKIKTLDEKNKALKYRLTLEKAEKEDLQNQQLKSEKSGFESNFERSTSTTAEIENLQNRISQLEAEKTGLQSGWSQYQKEMTNKVRDLTNENQNFRNAFDSCQSKQKLDIPVIKAYHTEKSEKDGLISRAKKEDSDKSNKSSIVITFVITILLLM